MSSYCIETGASDRVRACANLSDAMLEPGTLVGSYEIVESVGKGGMGEVYRARDNKLERDIALKVLPPEFSENAERIARFDREARLLGSLNHPNIATLHGLEENEGQKFLVMELVEGKTLDELGVLSLDDALPLFAQLADGLAAAHDQGVLHRDLKPANIKVTPDDKVKILDFGLAKALGDDEVESESSDSPTRTKDTALGTVIGTAPYMSPEQARGKPVDKRTDVWAYGCCLYESLTGGRGFDGETVADIIGAITKTEPDLTRVPLRARPLVERCLDKDVSTRLRDVGDARLLLEEREAPVAAPSRKLWLVAAVAVVVGAVGASFLTRTESRDPAAPLRRFVAATDAVTVGLGTNLAVSPDGSTLVYTAQEDGVDYLFSRPLDSVTAVKLPRTRDGRHPVFSPDGRQLAFFAEGQIKKMLVAGGTVTSLMEAPIFQGMTWESDESILVAQLSKGIFRLSSRGGAPAQFTFNEPSMSNGHFWPTMLPGRRGVLFTLRGPDNAQGAVLRDSRLAVADLETGEFRVLLDEEGYSGVYIPTGHLLFVRGYDVLVAAFDLDPLRVIGEPELAILDVDRKPGGIAQLSVASDGTLAYIPRTDRDRQRRLVWWDRSGAYSNATEESGMFTFSRISPDGRRIAFVPGPYNTAIQFYWGMRGYFRGAGVVIYDVDRGTQTPLRFSENGLAPSWSPDGARIAFTRQLPGDSERWGVFTSALVADEPPELVADAPFAKADGWTPDGSGIIVSRSREGDAFFDGDSVADLSLVSAEGGAAEAFLDNDVSEFDSALSPDGGLLAFVSMETGREEVHLATFPAPTRRWPVSSDGGFHPRWSPTGDELFYVYGNRLFSVDVERGDGIRLGPPRVVVDDPAIEVAAGWDVHPDGERFLFQRRLDEGRKDEIHVVLNWFQELERLVPLKR